MAAITGKASGDSLGDAVASPPMAWGSVAWGSVAWGSVAWGSVAWGSVARQLVAWRSGAWRPGEWRSGAWRPGLEARGSVTAEFALLLPSAVLLLAAVLGGASAGVAQVRCVDAARTGARLAARHESPAAVLAAARSAAPAGARVVVSAGGSVVRVRVSARVALPLPGRPGVTVRAEAAAHPEETAGLEGAARRETEAMAWSGGNPARRNETGAVPPW